MSTLKIFPINIKKHFAALWLPIIPKYSLLRFQSMFIYIFLFRYLDGLYINKIHSTLRQLTESFYLVSFTDNFLMVAKLVPCRPPIDAVFDGFRTANFLYARRWRNQPPSLTAVPSTRVAFPPWLRRSADNREKPRRRPIKHECCAWICKLISKSRFFVL